MKKYIVAIVIFLFLAGILVGLNYNYDISNIILNTSFHYSFFIFVLLILSFVLSLIGFPILIGFLGFECFLSGFWGITLFKLYKWKGLIFYSCHFIIIKLLPIFLFSLLAYYLLKLSKNLFYLLLKNNDCYLHNVFLYFKKILIISFFQIIASFLIIILNYLLVIPLAKHLLFL